MSLLPKVIPNSEVIPHILKRLHTIERKVNWLVTQNIPMTPGQVSAFLGEMGDQAYGSRTYAQHGDDMLLLNIFGALNIPSPTYLDIGAHDPYKISNTALLYRRGARGINVEANPKLIGAFKVQRPRDINLNVAVAGTPGTLTFHVFDATSGINTFDPARVREIEATTEFRVQERIEIPVVTVAEILAEHWPQGFPDLLSIDAEGLDVEILASIDYQRAAPKVICVEANSPEQGREIKALLETVGYRLFFRASVNLFFLQADLAQAVLTL